MDLQAEVARTKAELGIAFDGDGDRIGAVDENGRIIWGDMILILLGRDAVRRFGKGIPVIFDVKCSELLPQALEKAGAVPVMWKTGHSLIKNKMKEMSAPLAGEMSGHMFFGGDWFGFDDALFAAARLLEIVSREPGGLARLLADLPATFTTPELRIDCPEEIKFGVVARAAEYFGVPLPGEYDRWGAHRVPRGLGPDPRLEHGSAAGPSIRGRQRGGARALSPRGQRLARVPGRSHVGHVPPRTPAPRGVGARRRTPGSRQGTLPIPG